ncbi:uncharacterized protein At1g65710-like [Humulus lupulus]|uniref:uncharacterized protein At1g65710-like n=1 Tax=Humulus lupulus TaxID=3486 RepID=UPI002B4116ED|nr:uncharacterized protein At1g65710-like [Humulus lupulus]
MGTCLSKKKSSSSSSTAVVNGGSAINGVSPSVPLSVKQAVELPKKDKQQEEVKEEEGQPITQVKKEIFIIKHRRSHDDRAAEPNPKNQNPPLPLVAAVAAPSDDYDDETAASPQVHQFSAGSSAAAAGVRTSSCTKEEVDAILIQCGRLSRSSSGKAASSSSASRKYSGSKRSYDFDNNEAAIAANGGDGDDGVVTVSEESSHRHRERRQSSRSRTRASPSPQGRRRTPSRERGDQQRSASRERRVSRSPGRRSSEASGGGGSCSNSNNANVNLVNSNRPGKMVSIPATVSSLVMDKSNNLDSSAATVKRILVKRNVSDTGAASRGAASPRSQSPARANGNGASAKAAASNEQQQQPSLSRNSSRKAEHSPYRRNPLSEIDPNSLAYPNTTNNNRQQTKTKPRETDGITDDPNQVQKTNVGTDYRNGSRVSATKEQQATVETTVVISGPHKSSSQTQQPTITRSRSARRSRDLDFNPETLLHPNSNPDTTPSYTRLLLEDIQNFHQKNANTTTTVVSLPSCVSKACSILEAVADLNSTTGSSLSEDHFNSLMGSTPKSKDPFVESEVVIGCDDLTEPSFHKYVTVRRGGGGDAASEDQESSGSNSYVQQQQQRGSGMFSSSSVESTDYRAWRSNDEEAEGRRRLNERSKRDSYAGQPHSGGIGRGRLGSAKGLQTVSVVTST